jgi:predicted amidophosphoribosyltransferase
MLKHMNKSSHVFEFNSAKSKQSMYFMFSYLQDEIQKKIFGVKKALPEDIAWATAQFTSHITNQVPRDTTKIRIGIVPIPSRGYFRREKDNDHMLVVAKEIKKRIASTNMYNANVHVLDCLIPLSLSQQKKLSKEDRENRQHDMFTIDPIIKLFINRNQYTHIWIIDDVITTGSTLIAASQLISEHIKHKKIFVLGLAH